MSKKWFDSFLDSFESGKIYGQYGWLKPYQYKGLMELARQNNWRMISQKQLDCFMRNIKMKQSTWEDFGRYENEVRIVDIRISTQTGFATITITDK